MDGAHTLAWRSETSEDVLRKVFVQQPAMEIWLGQDANAKAAQQAQLHGAAATGLRAAANIMTR